MASSSHPSLPHPLGHPHHPPPSSSAASTSSTKPNSEFPTLPQNPSSNGRASSEKNPNSGAAITAAPEDVHLCNSSHLTHQEVLRRRAHNFNQLATVYKDHYWAMMEELKAKYKEYVWKFGLSPFKEGEEKEIFKEEVEDDGIEGKGEMGSEVNRQCLFHGCALKAMPLTKFCSLHILSDPKQVLYKPCEYVIKRIQTFAMTFRAMYHVSFEQLEILWTYRAWANQYWRPQKSVRTSRFVSNLYKPWLDGIQYLSLGKHV
ncbi:hypothetical protein TEA_003953 [Camellia sinensis var. sinensis]|uniref:KANL2-like probable zinc-finger domain-containing protein n=1 Tax=Camellia sinensis var. sinensis TaxID=542762 RepID=A0A4S4DRR0_CAMSN|nr:hypothetical protein TEA_003953 [Camellia sinensis var. sinensis]